MSDNKFMKLSYRIRYRLEEIGVKNLEQLKNTPDEKLLRLKGIGKYWLKRIRQIAPLETEETWEPCDTMFARMLEKLIRERRHQIVMEFSAETGISWRELEMWRSGVKEPSLEKVSAAGAWWLRQMVRGEKNDTGKDDRKRH